MHKVKLTNVYLNTLPPVIGDKINYAMFAAVVVQFTRKTSYIMQMFSSTFYIIWFTGWSISCIKEILCSQAITINLSASLELPIL